MPSIETKGARSYRVEALTPDRIRSTEARLHAGLGALVAALMLACAPEDLRSEADSRTVPAESVPEITESAPSTTVSTVPKARGLWILAEGSVRVLDDPARVADVLARAEKLQATDLFVQVYRGGRAFYAGPDSVERAPSIAEHEVDTLDLLITESHRRGLRVHAWVNVLSLSTRSDARLIDTLGRDAFLVDRLGRSVLDYPGFDLPEPDRRFYRMGTPGIYLDPGVPEVREHLVAVYRDLVVRYAGLDGLHLDYIRHPGVLPFSPGSRFGVGLEFGYGPIARARYRAETGNPDPIEGAEPGTVRGANDWDDWRRAQVTKLVEEISGTVRAARPGLVVSAAVIPYSDRAYLSLAQDWRFWLETGAIDLAIPMAYTLDDRLLGYQLESFAGWKHADRIWPGLGVWLFDAHPERALDQLRLLREHGFPGEVLFSDDAIAASPALFDALVALPPEPPR